MSDVRVVLVTLPDQEAARELCGTLLEERLVACGNLVDGVTSLYQWEGTLEVDREVLVVFKTAESVVPALIARITELHPYEVPEILALPVVAGGAKYLEWVARETGSWESS